MAAATATSEITSGVDRRAGVPWYLWVSALAVTSAYVGGYWDISWHRSIGRDSFWSAPHIAIYACGVLAGISSAYLIFSTTFGGNAALRDVSVRIWGLRGPLGAFIAAWGGVAMLVSAPFDDWWHNAYGLDVKILSPPHAVLAAGIGAIQLGAMIMAVAAQNRSGGRDRRLQWLFLYSAGLMLLNVATLSTEYIQRWDMHQALFFQVTCGVFPFFLVGVGRASTARWPATIAAGAYMSVVMLMLWILPLFEGRPLLGPIYVPLDRFLPPDPPLLLIVPAVAIDVVMRKFGRGRDWRLAAAIAILFFVLFGAVQWQFADFMTSEWSRNWVFASDRMAYMVHPTAQARWYRLNPPDDLLRELPLALFLAFVSARLGLWRGDWMAKVQR
jgi:hypothetical protein